jgi:hypothetical protein
MTLRDLFIAAVEKPAQMEALVRELVQRVFRIQVEQMAWHGQGTWDANLILENADEDRLLDVLTDFLWQNRHAPGVQP